MYKAFKTKLNLNNRVATLMAQHAGYARWVWNWGLALWGEAYRTGLKPNANKLKKLFTSHTKPEYAWMSKLSSRVYQYVFINLGEAFNRFFKGLAKYPRFKKKGRADSFTLDNGGKPILLTGIRNKLPFVGWVSTYEPLPSCETKKVTISRQADGWYISFHYSFDRIETHKEHDKVGVDLGINALATLSTGTVFQSIKPLKNALHKLARLSKSLSRKQKCSKNREKAREQVARLHQRVANIRRDTLNKITTFIAKNHGNIAIEDLNVSGMLANSKLARSIADQGFYEFRRQLEYKCSWYGSSLVVVDRFYPSSQLCSNCGHQQKMPLSVRQYDCPHCNMSIHRDLNASINLSAWVGEVPSPTAAMSKAVGYTVSICGRGAADSPG